MMTTAVQANPDVQSAGIRTLAGDILIQTDKHTEFWKHADAVKSTPTHMRFPLIINNIKRAFAEISFKALTSDQHPLLKIPTFIALIIFISLCGFVGF